MFRCPSKRRNLRAPAMRPSSGKGIESAVKKPRPTMKPLATPAPTPVPDWPERDADGFLAGDGEYFYENDDGGLWIYLSRSLQVTIVRREDSAIPLVWFETDIRTRDGEAFRAALTDPEHPGRDFQYPYVISRNEGFVLGTAAQMFSIAGPVIVFGCSSAALYGLLYFIFTKAGG